MTTTEHVRSMQFFRAEDGVDLDDTGMMTRGNEVDPEIFTTFDTRPLMDGSRVTVLFKGEGADGFSLVHAWFGPGYRLPRHSHSADCLYYVVKGELQMGTRVLHAGDGFFVAAEAPYTYTAGPDGVEVLEFRAATSFDIKVRDQTIEAWRPIMAAAAANHEKWVAATR